MGFTHLNKFLYDCYNDTTNHISIDKFLGKTVIIDFSQVINNKCRGRLSSGKHMTRYDGKKTTHIYAIFDIVMQYLNEGIIPFFVFDNKIPKEKLITTDNRKKHKEKAKLLCESAKKDNDFDKYAKNLKKSFTLSQKELNECKLILNLCGLAYFDKTIDEADPQCAALSLINKDNIMGIISEDTDMFAYGASKVYRSKYYDNTQKKYLFKSFTLNCDEMQLIELDRIKILKFLKNKSNVIRSNHSLDLFDEFTHINFLDFAIMLGCDYAPDNIKCSIRCKGYMTYDKLFEIFVINELDVEKTIKYLQDNLTTSNILISSDFIEQWKKIKNIYLRYNVVDPYTINIEPVPANIKKLVTFLCDDNELDKKYVLNKIINVIINIYKKYNVIDKSYNLYNILYRLSIRNIDKIYNIFNNVFVKNNYIMSDILKYI